jgi:hypothetical protein
MRRQIIQSGVHSRELFRIECCDEGYFAVREASPKFALQAADIATAAALAERALTLASAIEAATAGETSTKIEGSTEGDSAGPKDIAQTTSPSTPGSNP